MHQEACKIREKCIHKPVIEGFLSDSANNSDGEDSTYLDNQEVGL